MVGAVSGVGASSMQIRGGLDTSGIDAGFSRIRAGFENVKGHAKGLTSDFNRMSVASGDLVKNMGKLALVGTTAVMGIAAQAPAVAPALAKMSVAFDKISRSLGRALVPVFERLAVHLNNLSTWVSAHESDIRAFSTTLLDWGETIGNTLYPALSKVGSWAAEHPKLFAGIFAGITLGPIALKAIGAFTGFISTLATATVAPAVLTALGYAAAIAAGGAISFEAGKAAGASGPGRFLEESFVGDVVVGATSPLLKAGIGFKDWLTGGNELEQFTENLATWKGRQDDRRMSLQSIIDSVFG